MKKLEDKVDKIATLLLNTAEHYDTKLKNLAKA